jgi:hypothetical protein
MFRGPSDRIWLAELFAFIRAIRGRTQIECTRVAAPLLISSGHQPLAHVTYQCLSISPFPHCHLSPVACHLLATPIIAFSPRHSSIRSDGGSPVTCFVRALRVSNASIRVHQRASVL